MPPRNAEIKRTPDDFQVTELLQPSFDDDGEHAWLWVEKTGANTEWVARQLARFAGVGSRDVGYAGLKDRHARTWQWFSVRAPRDLDWTSAVIDGVRIHECRRHRRKLRRGAHRGNRFSIVVHGDVIGAAENELVDNLQRIRTTGVPNYFGEQRFGRGGSNLALAEDWGKGVRLPRQKRSIAISAARAAIFNAILDRRVGDGSWNRIVDGERANLDGSASVFAVERAEGELQRRCDAFDIHPTATLWGRGAPLSGGTLAELERDAAAGHSVLARALEDGGVDAASRASRLAVQNLEWSLEESALTLDFELTTGGYATTVVDQLFRSST